MPTETYHTSRKKDADEKQRIYEQTVHYLQNDERLKNYLNAYTADSVKSFIEFYAHQKAEWFINGDTMLNLRKHHETQWEENALMILKHIQLKKLFNAECEWRAEKMTLPGIEICLDFMVWSRKVLDCPFIKPVTEEEVNLYISFLGDLDDKISFDDYNIGNDYPTLKDGFYKKGKYYSEYPPWYSYYDAHFGIERLLLLPDIRGDKEKFYNELFHKEQQPLRDEQKAARDKRPHIGSIYEKNFTEWFLKEFDSKETLKLYHNTLQWDEKHQRIEDIDMELINLGEADRDVAVEDDEDWRNGIKRGAEKYYRQRTIEVLPAAWESYCSRIDAGKPFTEEDEENTFTGLRNQVMDQILRGREMNKEPRDLNF